MTNGQGLNLILNNVRFRTRTIKLISIPQSGTGSLLTQQRLLSSADRLLAKTAHRAVY
jgi:hypothetical protein